MSENPTPSDGDARGPIVRLPAAVRWRRFLLGFGVTLVIAVLARMGLTAVTGRADPLSPGFVLDAVISGAFLAALVGLYLAFRVRRLRPGLLPGREPGPSDRMPE